MASKRSKARHYARVAQPAPAHPAIRARQVPTIAAVSTLLAAGVWASYGQTLHHGLVNYDDPAYTNATVARGLTAQGFRFAFTQGDIGHWHPATWLSHMLDFAFYGSNFGLHHLTSVILHGLSTILLFLLLWRGTSAVWRSAIVAAIFGMHPLRVESVAWISERKDVLSGLFFMLTLAAYFAYAHRPARFRYVVTIVVYVLALLAKNMLITVPLVLLLLDYWPLRRVDRMGLRRVLMEKIPFAALSVASAIVTLLVPERLPPSERVGFLLRIENATVTTTSYLWQMLWPGRLAVYYPYPKAFAVWGVAASIAFLATVTFVTLALRRRAPYALVGWLWFLFMLIPVAGLVQISNYSHADRYTYLPHIGISLLLVWAIADICRRSGAAIAASAVAAVLAVGAFTWQARAQTAVWSDSERLWRHAISVTGDNAVADSALGSALSAAGNRDDAMRLFQKAVQANPAYFPAQDSLGRELAARGRTDEAIAHYREAIRVWPPYTRGHCDLGNALLAVGHVDEALAEYQRALLLQPVSYDAALGCGNALMAKGDPARAERLYRRALDIDRGSAIAIASIGNALAAQGRLQDAETYVGEALRISPTNAVLRCKLADVLLAEEKTAGALEQYRLAIAQNPGLPNAHAGLAAALAQAKRYEEAIAQFRIALQLNPVDAETRVNLGLALAALGRFEDATAQYRMAIRVRPDAPEAYVYLGSALALKHHFPEAIADLTRGSELDRGNARTLDKLAAVYAMAGRFADAARIATTGAAAAASHHDEPLAASLRQDASEYSARARAH